jgi:hypothetical protein
MVCILKNAEKGAWEPQKRHCTMQRMLEDISMAPIEHLLISVLVSNPPESDPFPITPPQKKSVKGSICQSPCRNPGWLNSLS